jgi:3-isopropylmalate dehydrogenase
MGLPDVRYPDGTEISPQIDLRKALGLFAGVRPVRVAPGQASPLTLPPGREIDFVLIRESTEGLFHSQGNGVVTEDRGAGDPAHHARGTSEKLFRFAFALAGERKARGADPAASPASTRPTCSAPSPSSARSSTPRRRATPIFEADHAYVDATALWMVQAPWAFDVLVTENMFGDILSDLGAG